MKRFPDIVAFRHGQSLANRLGDASFLADDPIKHAPLLLLEDSEVPLTEDVGILQAKKLGKFLRKKFGKPDVVIDPGYKRSMQTREFALHSGYSKKEIEGMIIRTDDRIRERECGVLRKTPLAIRESIPHWQYHQKAWLANPYQTRPLGGGESIADMVVRVHSILAEIRDLYGGKLIFLSCHGHTLHALQIAIEGFSLAESNAMLADGWVNNCTIHFYKGKKKRWTECRAFDPLK